MSRALERMPRGGSVDILFVLLAAWALWTRTPVGQLAQWSVDAATQEGVGWPELTATFSADRTTPWWVESDTVPVARPATEAPPDGLPEPYRTAALTALRALPEAAQARVDALADTPDDERLLKLLDSLHKTHGDPELALADLAIGAEQLDRALTRARAVGEPHPQRWETLRRYVPEADVHDGEQIVSSTLALATVLDLHWPVSTPHRISSPFGYRKHPTLKKRKFHNGIDLAVPVGTPIEAAQDGVLEVVAEDKVSGKYVIIDHGNGVKTAYCHLSQLPADPTSKVSQGTIFAKSGNTGRSSGPHLHFIVRIGGKPVDPARFRREDTAKR